MSCRYVEMCASHSCCIYISCTGEESVPSGVSVPIVTNDSAVIRWNSVMHVSGALLHALYS